MLRLEISDRELRVLDSEGPGIANGISYVRRETVLCRIALVHHAPDDRVELGVRFFCSDLYPFAANFLRTPSLGL